MKRVLCVSLVLLAALTVVAARRPARFARSLLLGDNSNPGWTTTITTNELNQITKTASRVDTNGVEHVVVFVDNGVEVPFKYRHLWSTATQEQKDLWLSLVEMDITKTPPKQEILPVPVAPKNPTDENITTEIRETKLRW